MRWPPARCDPLSSPDSAVSLFRAACAGHTILAPNTELAAALFAAVEREHLRTGNAVWPTPRIRDFAGWLRERHAARQLLDSSLPRALSDVEERELWRAVVLEGDSSRNFLEPNGAARGARRARRAMIEHGIPMRRLAESAAEESMALLRWNRRFEERCRDLGRIATDQLLGFADPESVGLRWVESPHWQPQARRWLERGGAPPLESVPIPGSARNRRLAAPSAETEIAAIADWARANLQAQEGFRAWVCVPDLSLRRAEVIDAFDAALAPRRFSHPDGEEPAAPYAVAGGTPLAEHAPVKAALRTLSASTGIVPFEAFSVLLRMPELHASHSEAAAAAMLDLGLRRRGPNEAPVEDWLALAERDSGDAPRAALAGLRRLRDSLDLLREVRGDHRMSRWIAVWTDAFDAGPWALRHRWSSAEFQSAERFRELLAALATADDVFGQRSAAAAARVLQRAAADATFQPQTGIPPIWVSGQVMDPWLKYDGLWIAGCGEDRWPPPPDPVALVPVGLQREYGVVSAGVDTQAALAADLQRRWSMRAPACVFSCAVSSEGQAAALSPLLPAAPMLDGPPAPTRPHWHAAAAQAPRIERLADEAAPPFTAEEHTRGVATLRAQSRCAFRGFAETRLGVEALDRPQPGFNMRERGELLHQALEYLWSDLRSSARLAALEPAGRAALLSVCVTRAIDRQCQRRDPGERWRRREAARMTVLLDKWLSAESEREPFEVDTLEPGSQVARHGGLAFDVRIDRIDRLAAGGTVLIDYKTGAAAADWRGDRPDNPQLPIYALLRPDGLVAVAYGKVNARKCGFVAEAGRAGIFKPGGRPTALEGMPDFASLIALWSRRLEVIAAQFAAGDAAVAPTLRACASCGLQPFCRVPAGVDEAGAEDE